MDSDKVYNKGRVNLGHPAVGGLPGRGRGGSQHIPPYLLPEQGGGQPPHTRPDDPLTPGGANRADGPLGRNHGLSAPRGTLPATPPNPHSHPRPPHPNFIILTCCPTFILNPGRICPLLSISRCAYICEEAQTDRDRQTGRQTDWQRQTETDRQTDRQKRTAGDSSSHMDRPRRSWC